MYISFTTSARVECEERAGILHVKMGTDDPAFDAPRRRRDDHRSFRQKLLVFFAFLAFVCTSFVLFYDFDDTDDGSKSAPSQSSGRKLGPVNGNEKGDGNVFGHSLVKGEDEVVEKIEFWPSSILITYHVLKPPNPSTRKCKLWLCLVDTQKTRTDSYSLL